MVNVFNHSPFEEIMIKSMKFVKQSHIEGDYMEFGVYEGNTFIKAFHIAKIFNLKIFTKLRCIFAIDNLSF